MKALASPNLGSDACANDAGAGVLAAVLATHAAAVAKAGFLTNQLPRAVATLGFHTRLAYG